MSTEPHGLTFDVLTDDLAWFELSIARHPDWSRAEEGWTAPLRWTWGIYRRENRYSTRGDPVTGSATYHDTREGAYAEMMTALLAVLDGATEGEETR